MWRYNTFLPNSNETVRIHQKSVIENNNHQVWKIYHFTAKKNATFGMIITGPLLTKWTPPSTDMKSSAVDTFYKE